MKHPAWLVEAKQHWEDDRGYDAGRLICEHISPQVQPLWGGRILCFMMQRAKVSDPVLDCVKRLSMTPSEWGNGHDVFTKVREVTLQHDKLSKESSADETLSWILAVAEQTAKVSYNATFPQDEFDDDSAAWIIACLRGFASVMNEYCFYEEAWQVACDGVELS
ncbi:hypothetical protein Mal52_37630 [Symmachiella dynata]|uniref:Uncharacterized protein n=1 Tax=Symmachiella dynata TaxID=2527995 RepID=A0A517ZS02_9PLAN|nr:hypothetical protein [Symmachiella dynata]QDU45271.1 hypothetical protein Mal52_37630 [Symmachiella dynata]